MLLETFGIHEKINLICPGPSADNFDLEKEEGLCIFVNHAAQLISCDKKILMNSIHFSADPIRARELIDIKPEIFRFCKSVLVAGRLFSLSASIYKYYDYIFLPLLRFDKKYGLVSKGLPLSKFGKLNDRSIGCGYGSLPAAISFSLIFSPKEIKLWGCDFGDSKGKKYINKPIPERNDTPHDRIKYDVMKIKNILFDIDVKLIDSNDNL